MRPELPGKDSSLAAQLGVPLLAGILYCVIASSTMILTSSDHQVAALWPANAVVLALLLLIPRRTWTPVLVAGFAASLFASFVTSGTLVAPLLFSLANSVEILVAAVALSARTDRPWALREPAAVMPFLFWAGLAAPAISGVIGALTKWAFFDQPLLLSLAHWQTADGLGLIIFTPFFASLFRGDFARYIRDLGRRQRLEAVALLALTTGVTIWAFYITPYPALFMLMVPLMLMTFRVGMLGAKTALMIVAVIGSMATVAGRGPITHVDPNPDVQILLLQVVMAAYCAIVLPIAAVLAARNDLIVRLKESEQSLRLLAAQSPVLILSFDLAGTCQRVIGTADLLLDRDPATLAGKSFRDISEEGQLELRRTHNAALDDVDHSHAAEFRAFKVNDHWLEAVFRANFDADGRCIGTLATLHDVTARKNQELSLSRSASTDSLTGLLNRAGFRDRLERALSTAAPGGVSLAMIDVDKFKLVNDNLGHQIGDVVLKEIARRISSEVRASDAVGRLGGDEFIILLTTPDWDKVREICNRVVHAVDSQAIELPSGNHLSTAVSCGVARYRLDFTADDFIHEADVALYEAKRAGRNRVVAA